MAPFVLLVAVFLLASYEGSRAVTPVFVKKGNDLLLDVIKANVPEDFNFLIWKFNESDVLVTFSPGTEPKVSKVYTGRVEFSKENYSVKLKNQQETDSGVYTARVTGAKDKIVAEYKVTVQDPVSPVKLTVKPVSSSSDSCNLTVTCRTQDSDISSTFRCVNQICSEDGGETSKTTTSGAVLHVYFVNHSIICNHSNQVSWTTNRGQTKIQDFCPLNNVTAVPNGATIPVSIVLTLLLVMAVSICCVIKWKKNKQQKQNNEYTVYAVPEDACPAQTRDQDHNQNPVTSTYALVDFHSGPGTTNITNNTSLPETIYAQVNRAAKSRSNPPPQPAP